MIRRVLLTTAAAGAALSTIPAHACPVCVGNTDSELAKGAASGILMLLILTYTLLVGVGGIATFWAIRARRLRMHNARPQPAAASPAPCSSTTS